MYRVFLQEILYDSWYDRDILIFHQTSMILCQKIFWKTELIVNISFFSPPVIQQPSSASRKSTTNAMMQDLFVASTSRPASRAASAAASRRNSIGSANSAEMAADAAYNQELNHGKSIY